MKVVQIVIFAFRTFSERRQLTLFRRLYKSAHFPEFNKPILVIANGPSAGRLDVEAVRMFQQDGGNVICLNWINESDISSRLIPDFLVLSDPLTQRRVGDQRAAALWDYIDHNPEIGLVLPHDWVEMDSKGSHRKFFFDDRELIGVSKNISPRRPRGYSSMTAFKALAFALHLTSAECWIIGFDNSMYLSVDVSKDNRLFESPLHFYDSEKSLKENCRDVTSEYPFGMSDYLYNHARLFGELRSLFPRERIVNLDAHSLTDAFPKLERERLLKDLKDDGR